MIKTTILKSVTIVCSFCLLFVSTVAVQAAPIIDPGLGAGNQYRLMFRTTLTHDATSNDISVYNAFVTSVSNANATLAALGTTWMAVGSTDTVDARDNTNTNPLTDTGVPIYLLDGTTKIADNNADLWDGTIDAFIERDENGDLNQGGSVFTGSVADGTAATFAALGTGFGFSNAGLPNATNSNWIAASAPATTTSLTFFAISGLIEEGVALPPLSEPGTLAVFGLSLLGLSIVRRRNHNAAAFHAGES